MDRIPSICKSLELHILRAESPKKWSIQKIFIEGRIQLFMAMNEAMLESCISKAVDGMSRRAFSERTIESYTFCLRRFLINFEDYRKISKKDIRDYLNELSNSGVSGSTLNLYLCSIKFFLEEVMHRNLNIDIKFSRRPKTLTVVLSKQEVKSLIYNIHNKKHKLMISFMYSTGLRVSELVNFRVKDLELDNNVGWVRHGKGDKDRQIIISEKLIEELKRLVIYSKNREEFLFINNRGESYSTRTIDAIIKRAAKLTKINKKIHPHTLRHSFATHLIQDGYSVGDVQVVMGHSSAETTMIYVHCAADMLKIKSPFDSL